MDRAHHAVAREEVAPDVPGERLTEEGLLRAIREVDNKISADVPVDERQPVTVGDVPVGAQVWSAPDL